MTGGFCGLFFIGVLLATVAMGGAPAIRPVQQALLSGHSRGGQRDQQWPDR